MTGNGRVFQKTPFIWIPAQSGKSIFPKEDIKGYLDFYGGFGEYNGYPRNMTCEGCSPYARKVRSEISTKIPENYRFILPPKYIKSLRKPIEARITYLGKPRIERGTRYVNLVGREDRASITPVMINAGRSKGVTKGLMFLIGDETYEHSYQVLKVTRVGLRSSEGIVLRSADKRGRELYPGSAWDKKANTPFYKPFPPLKKGMRVSTSFP